MSDNHSLIKEFYVESVEGVAKNKITFIVVNDKKLVYYTNSEKFLKSLEKFKDKKFIIHYAFSELLNDSFVPKPKARAKTGKRTSKYIEPVDTNKEFKIVRVKLPKLKSE